MATDRALHFVQDVKPSYKIWTDDNEWAWRRGDNLILHIDMRKWADVLLLAPLSANTLAKAANGLSDNLVTSVIRAWDWKNKKVFFAPAMNTYMWDNIITQTHLGTLTSWGAVLIPPISKTLACGDTGVGAMADIKDIVKAVRS